MNLTSENVNVADKILTNKREGYKVTQNPILKTPKIIKLCNHSKK